MEAQNIIEFQDVSMLFSLSKEKNDTLKEFIIKASQRKLEYHDFYALKNVSLSVKRGESFALIGRNGCGKSTLLKLVAGVYSPSSGSVVVGGSVAPLIELGAGFDMDLTARENVFLNGAVLGLSRREMNERLQGIIEFAELEEFVDVPLKNYSSGMIARLGFSIATSVQADILVVDEVLSVGDVMFQEKCQARMESMLSGGTTLLFVSHNGAQVKKLCTRAAWIDHGRVQEIGDATEVYRHYFEYSEAHA